MILAEYTVVCDGCGRQGPSSDRLRTDAQLRAQADHWTCDMVDNRPIAAKHWCPECTKARRETAP